MGRISALLATIVLAVMTPLSTADAQPAPDPAGAPDTPASPAPLLPGLGEDTQVMRAGDAIPEAAQPPVAELLQVTDHRNFAAWLGAMASFVERAAGLEAIAAIDPTLPAQEEGQGQPVQPVSLAKATPAGDLNGDQLADVFVVDFEPGMRAGVLRALDGRDGSELWRQGEPGAVGTLGFPIRRDVTGDGASDLVRYDLLVTLIDGDFGCAEGNTSCTQKVHIEYTWQMALISGGTGGIAWSDAVQGRIDETTVSNAEDLGYSQQYTFDSTNAFYVPFVSGDHDGDGLDDIILDALDVRQSTNESGTDLAAVIIFAGDNAINGTTRATVRSGRTGAILFSRSEGPAPAITFLLPVGDALGGSRSDVVWERIVFGDDSFSCITRATELCTDERDRNFAYELEAIDGETWSRGWASSVPSAAPAGLLARQLVDLTGDGKVDPIRLTVEPGGDLSIDPGSRAAPVQPPGMGTVFARSILDGTTGKIVWDERGPAPLLPPLGVDQLDGGPGTDLLFSDPHFAQETIRVVIERVDGATGRVIRSTATEFARIPSRRFIDAVIYTFPSSDADGDAVTDVGFGYTEVVPGDETTGTQRVARSEGVLESGRSGTHIYRFVNAQNTQLFATEDLDGDGLAEMFADTVTSALNEPIRLRRDALLPRGGAVLWSLDAEPGRNQIEAAGDQDGRPGEEILNVTERSADGGLRGMVASLEGRTANVRWSTTSLP